MGIRRPDFTEVKPTVEELEEWVRKHPLRRPPYRAVHDRCGKRIWYSGVGIGAHLRACYKHDRGWVDEPARVATMQTEQVDYADTVDTSEEP
jgi:hypothetical protein